jgi:error-prone DNA polymerase
VLSPVSLPDYAELLCRSNFSFLSGASQPAELVRQAQARGYTALAITDECSFAGVVRAHEEATEIKLPLIIGTEMRLSPLPTMPLVVEEPPAAAAGSAASVLAEDFPLLDDLPPALTAEDLPPTDELRLVLLATSRRGYSLLSRWITLARRRAPKGRYRAHASDLEGRAPAEPSLAGLPECLALLLPQPQQTPSSFFAQATWLQRWFGDRAYLAIARQHRPHEAQAMDIVVQVARATGLAVTAVGDVRMHVRSRKPLLDVLEATRLKKPIAECGFELTANAEAHLRSRQRLAALYRPEWLAESVRIAARCRFSLNELRYEYPREIVPDGHTPTSWLRELTEQGARARFAHEPGGVPPKVRTLIEHELALIAHLHYEAYFLTVADVVRWAREQGILCQGRGSAANSAVCYCLHVTEVDPAQTSVLFERFISAERNEPPDIDVDFEHQRREEVIQYLYRKYGRHRAALAAVVISYRPRSALRDVGRALGIDIDRIEAVSRSQHWFDGRRIAPERLSENGFDPDAPLVRLWTDLTQQLIGFPRHLSQHPGGFVIACEHVADLVPVENATMPDRTVIQWDKDDLESLKLLKVDILALGMLSALRRALEFVGAKEGRPSLPMPMSMPIAGARSRDHMPFEMQDIPRDDPRVFDMLCRGDSIGTFQVESRAQMSMLPRLKPRNYYDLVIEVAIVRPGPIQGGMVHPYLRRRNGEEPVEYPSDEVKQALQRTLGVPIFQEQVMQLAINAADFTPGEADKLRRAMAAWKRKGGLGPFYERLVGRMVEKGYPQDYAERIFKQIQGFGEYGFPESHAASFALLVYISAWIKCHHPDAFLAALLNSQPMGFYMPAQLVRDAREHGVTVLPVDVWKSRWETVLEPEAGIAPAGSVLTIAEGEAAAPLRNTRPLWPVRLGFSRLSGFGEEAARRIEAARTQGPFNGVEDLARRAALDGRELEILAQGDALKPLSGHRHQAAWGAAGVDTHATAMLRSTRTHEPTAQLDAPSMAADVLADYRSAGLSLKAHPLALLRPELMRFQVQTASTLNASARNGQLVRASGLVTHRQRPETARGVIFVTLEDDTGAVNVIVWPQVAEAQRTPLLASRLLTVYGVWQCQGPVRHLIARRLVDHTALLEGISVRSRDFR